MYKITKCKECMFIFFKNREKIWYDWYWTIFSRPWGKRQTLHIRIETVSPEDTFCDTVQVPSRGGDMDLI